VIGITLPYARDSLTIDILLGAESAAKSRGYSLLFSYTDEDVQQEANDFQRMRTENAKGFIIFPNTNVTYDESIWQLRKEAFPFVLVDRYFANLSSDYVGVDNLGGAYRVTEHLINLGHTAIAFIGASDTQTTSVKDRFQGYKRALSDHGITFRENWHGSYTVANGGEAVEAEMIQQYLSQSQTPKAIVAVNDYTAIKVVRAARRLGLRIPQDLAVVGFDDIQQASQIEVPLTTVAQPRYEIGVRAAHLLIDRLKGVKTGLSQLILPTSLVVRDSCGARLRLDR
jgi:DNA-binding LacI/PurR family transcriptional regulator